MSYSFHELKRRNQVQEPSNPEPLPPDKPLEQPENLIQEYNLKIPFYGIPPEVLNTLVRMITEVAKYQAPMQEKIGELPTWTDWKEDIHPTMREAMSSHTQAVRACESSLKRAFDNQTETVTAAVMKSVNGKLSKLEQTLQARDNTTTKRRWQWMGIGAALLLMLSGLLLLLKIWLL